MAAILLTALGAILGSFAGIIVYLLVVFAPLSKIVPLLQAKGICLSLRGRTLLGVAFTIAPTALLIWGARWMQEDAFSSMCLYGCAVGGVASVAKVYISAWMEAKER